MIAPLFKVPQPVSQQTKRGLAAMARNILIRNDENDRFRKSYWVHKNLEQSLTKLGRATGREIKKNFAIEEYCQPRRCTTYSSPDSVISIGLSAHARLANVIKTSLIYLDPEESGPVPAGSVNLTAIAKAARTASKMIFVGRDAGHFSHFVPCASAQSRDLPPLDLSGLSEGAAEAPRLTIVNHLADERFAQRLTRRFLDGSDFFLECVGLEGGSHNRVRYLGDAEIGDAAASVHIHVGLQAGDSERLRIVDSWQSSVPVLFFDVTDEFCRSADPVRQDDLRDEHNILTCDSYEEACHFLALLLETPNLRRLITANGRSSAAPHADAWTEIARDLAA